MLELVPGIDICRQGNCFHLYLCRYIDSLRIDQAFSSYIDSRCDMEMHHDHQYYMV
jgi:hypothetical protein